MRKSRLSNGKYRDRPTGRYHSNCKRIRGEMTGPLYARPVLEPNVRFGSLADISQRIRDVRFTPESGHDSAAAKRIREPRSMGFPLTLPKTLRGKKNS